MDYKEYFVPYAKEIDKFLALFLDSKKKEAAKITPVARVIWQNLETFIKGGKRIRGGLVRLGYETFGGKNVKDLIPISAAIELTHGAILVHDDIIDQDILRHNRPTVHKAYESFHKKRYKKGDPLHYGESMAICVGDAGFYEAISLIAQSSFPDPLKIKAINSLSENMINTSYGEALDVDLSYRKSKKEKDVNTINILKTAHYTLVGPLKLGAILAGADPGKFKIFEDYGQPLGVAFQIQDDILGMFGSQEKFGKSTDSDIREGKNTLLYSQAVKRATKTQKKTLQTLWGKKDITKKEADKVRKIIKNTGSLDYNMQTSLKLVEETKKAVPKITKDKQSLFHRNKSLQEVYLTLADFIIEREK